MKDFSLGQLISAYDEEGCPCRGRISAFDGTDPELGPMAHISLYIKDPNGKTRYARIRLDTAHHLPILFARHSKETFLAAASRSGPCLYFKNDKARRDYLETLWDEMCKFSQEDPDSN